MPPFDHFLREGTKKFICFPNCHGCETGIPFDPIHHPFSDPTHPPLLFLFLLLPSPNIHSKSSLFPLVDHLRRGSRCRLRSWCWLFGIYSSMFCHVLSSMPWESIRCITGIDVIGLFFSPQRNDCLFSLTLLLKLHTPLSSISLLINLVKYPIRVHHTT